MTVQVFPVQSGMTAKNVPWILAKSNVAVTRNSTNTSATAGVDDDEEVTMATITIPANLLVGSVSLHLYALWRGTSSVSTKNYITRIAGTSVGSHTATTNIMAQTSFYIHADNAYNDQKGVNSSTGGDNGGSSAANDLSFNNSSALDITFTCKWSAAVAAETIVLEGYRITVWPE